MGTSLWRRVVALIFLLFAATPARTQTVSLLNGSQLSMTGLKLTVSNCAIVIAGWQQTSCAAGNLVMQAVSGGRDASIYQIAWDSDGNNGLSNAVQVGPSSMYQLSFALAVATVQPASLVNATTLTALSAGGGYCQTPCGSDLTASQAYSAAAGGMHITADLLTAASVSATLTRANAFTINEIVTMNTTYLNQLANGFDPDVPFMTLTRQSITTTMEPASILLLVSGIAGLVLLRSRRPSPVRDGTGPPRPLRDRTDLARRCRVEVYPRSRPITRAV